MIFCNEFVAINFSPSSKMEKQNIVIITISGIGHENEADNYILLNEDFDDFNVLGITNKKRDFFINDFTMDVVNFLKKFLINYSEVIVISHSMGGFFAFYIMNHVEIDLCIVCSPYLSLSSDEMNLNGEENRILSEKINSHHIENYCIKNIKAASLSVKNQEKCILIIDPACSEDNKTSILVDKFFKNINIILLPNSGHLSLYYLEKRNVISSLIRNKIGKIECSIVKKIMEGILKFYLNCVSCGSEKICIKSQVYFNNPDLYKNYYSFVYGENSLEQSDEYFLYLNKYGSIMSFSLSKSGFYWSGMPFDDSLFAPIIINKSKSSCFCFYDENLIEMDYEKISFEVNKSDRNYLKIPFSRDFFTKYFNELKFNEKINVFSIINSNKKIEKKKSNFSLRGIWGSRSI